MADSSKIRTLLLFVVIILSLGLAGGVYMLLQKEHAKNIELQTQLEDVKTKQRVAETRLEESKKIISDMETKLQDTQGKIDTLNADLQKEKNAKQEAIAQIDELKSEVDNQKQLRADVEKKLTQAQDDLKKTQGQLKELGTQKTDLESKLKEVQVKAKELEVKSSSPVELGTVVVNPETGQPASATSEQYVESVSGPQASSSQGLEGKVLVINKDYNFAVVNLGSRDGINLGSIFSIYHGDQYLGDLKVEKVHDSMAAAGFLSTDVKEKISEGDKAILKTQ
jgi:septal ring factor EnvC (AmiA/AmiB activator)